MYAWGYDFYELVTTFPETAADVEDSAAPVPLMEDNSKEAAPVEPALTPVYTSNLLGMNKECSSYDEWVNGVSNMPGADSVERCLNACIATDGCKMFLTHWRYDMCYHEMTTGDNGDCTGAGEYLKSASNFDLYELVTTYV